MLKFPLLGGILTLRSRRIIPLECIMVSGPEARPSDITQATEERIKVAIHPEHPKQTITICSTLTEEGRKALYDLIRRSLDVFAWKTTDIPETEEAKAAFKEMKKLITELPTLTAPMEKEELTVYLVAVREAPRPTRSRDKLYVNGKVGVSFSTCKKTDKNILPGSYNQVDTVKTRGRKRLQKWSIELGEYDIQYRPRTSVKGQILADFIVERPKDDPLDTPMEAEEELPDP
ncbi:hypothetical protein Tco_1312795 [Tanacetum coccineum]